MTLKAIFSYSDKCVNLDLFPFIDIFLGNEYIFNPVLIIKTESLWNKNGSLFSTGKYAYVLLYIFRSEVTKVFYIYTLIYYIIIFIHTS